MGLGRVGRCWETGMEGLGSRQVGGMSVVFAVTSAPTAVTETASAREVAAVPVTLTATPAEIVVAL